MTIQIDDQGWGTPVGGVGIIVVRKETFELYYDIIPIEDFRNDTFRRKTYLQSARNIVEKGVRELNISKDEEIEICSGCVHDRTVQWLKNEGYKFAVKKIDGIAQNKGEELFIKYLCSLGVTDPPQIIEETVNEYKAQFFYLMDWVREDTSGRIHLCKTGWKFFKKFLRDHKEIH
ncbi:MAG: hypothetical protein OIN87_05240 [Candidatus Methanoperedens sp.]|nr:hypothetical protein [Candidatus Methanoperedens sp.]